MTKYYARRGLNLKAIGLDTNDRAYAKLLKDKKISKIHTRAGLVQVKFVGAVEFITVLSLNDLRKADERVEP